MHPLSRSEHRSLGRGSCCRHQRSVTHAPDEQGRSGPGRRVPPSQSIRSLVQSSAVDPAFDTAASPQQLARRRGLASPRRLQREVLAPPGEGAVWEFGRHCRVAGVAGVSPSVIETAAPDETQQRGGIAASPTSAYAPAMPHRQPLQLRQLRPRRRQGSAEEAAAVGLGKPVAEVRPHPVNPTAAEPPIACAA